MGDVLWWLVVAVVFLVAEFGHRAFIAMFIAIGAFVAAICAVAGAPVIVQFPVFIGSAILSLVAMRPTLMRVMARGSQRLISGVRGHIGHEAVVAERVGGMTHPGRIKVDGELWKAATQDGTAIEAGTVVMILDLQGTTFIVEDLRSLGLDSSLQLPSDD